MKSNAPWSVKGIERDARETAKEAARREGMTVGEWLNQMIYSQAEGGGPNALSDAEVEGLRLRDIVTAIEHLRNRVVDAESKNAAVVAELTRNMGGFVERVQRLERVKPAEGSYQDVVQRVEKLERAGGDRGRIEALKALEKAVAQVAIQFNNAQRTTITRLDSAEAQLQEFAARIDRVGDGAGEPAELGSLKSAIENLAQRVTKAEQIAQEAAALKTEAADSSDPEFVERTGARLRVLGDEIKRGGDQIRALEGTIAKLSGQIEAAEKRSADGVQKVAETIAEVRTQLAVENDNGPDVEAMLAAVRSETEGKLEALERSLEDMQARFEELGRATAQPTPPSSGAPAALAVAPAPVKTKAAEAIPPFSSDDFDDVVDEIEEAVDAMEAEGGGAEEDPFAFSDETDETGAGAADETEALAAETDDGADGEAVEDFSFQIDDDAQGDVQETGDEDITVSADGDDDTDENMNEAEALLAEVRSALTGEGLAQDSDEEDEDVSIAEDEEDDKQAPNTASLASAMAIETDEPDEETAAPATKEDMLKAARQRAREAAARGAEADPENGRPRRSQLTAKQRAILAARARQKRAAEEAAEPAEEELAEEAGHSAHKAEAPDAFSLHDGEELEEESPQGRFSKITAALAAAKARISRKKDVREEDADVPAQTAAASYDDEAESRRRNGDRAALETLKSTTSAKPLTIALGVAVLLAIAALVYLVKDFVFKSGSETQGAITAVERTVTPAQTAPAPEANLPSVPAAPAIDPQALYVESMDALAAATSETGAKAAIAKLQDAAALGYPPAQLQLGELYKTGQGVEQDLGQARVWFRRAANGGNVLAMHRIGVMTARGDGGPADSQEAIAWFEQAANFGLVDSQYNLGAIYHPSEDAVSSVQDAAKAYYWYSLAARNGDEQAQPLAAGVGVALSPETRAGIDEDVAAWTATPADETANLNAHSG
ncbi:hypothetical protein [Hyphococcus sp.]|jgi:localization factor PodJL|uniref:tetratricopeptide repeat protein n=1 Tax=Hyphococcus sp. TaxID=2038636 RepID=UPI003D104408